MAGPVRGKGNPIRGMFWLTSMTFFVGAIIFGTIFLATSGSQNFFTWKSDTCVVTGPYAESSAIDFNIFMEADIGWREFTVSLDIGGARCFDDLKQGASYALGDFDDNNSEAAGVGMAIVWGLAIFVAVVTVSLMQIVSCRMRRSFVSIKMLYHLCCISFLGIITATTVFWWLVEGKFGDREEALSYQLVKFIRAADARCRGDDYQDDDEGYCRRIDWYMDAPGWSLACGITSMFLYGAATILLWMRASRTDALLNGADEPDPAEPVKNVVGDRVPAGSAQADDKARGKDRRSARTGSRAPTSTVVGDPAPEASDPMTYALEEGGDPETGSQDDPAEGEVLYQNYQVHPSIVNHSTSNQTQPRPDDTMSRQSEAMSRASPAHHIAAGTRQRQYSRGYSRGTSGASYTTGGHSFETPSEAEYSEAASSAQYYAPHPQGNQSFMSVESMGDSFDDYRTGGRD